MKKDTNEIYAAKISLNEMDSSERDLIKNLSREIDIISQLNHPSILQYIGYNPRNFKLKPKPTIITEYATNNSLDKVIKLESLSHSIPDWNDTKKLINIYGIASGMSYLHNKNILHRDLKSENIFLDQFLYPKIGDFGLSKKITENSSSESTINPSGYKGTLIYSAPEVLKECLYSKSGDVYSFGMIVYEIMNADFPFKDVNRYEFYKIIFKGFSPEFKKSFPNCYKELIKKCLSVNPDERPSFEFIKKMIEEKSDFITDKIDKEEFLNYVSYINKREKHLDSLFHKVSIEITKNEDKEVDDQLSKLFLNLNEFEKLEMISKRYNSKLYKVVNIKSKGLYLANISSTRMRKIKEDEIASLNNEVTFILSLYHPSLLKVIGYSPFNFSNQKRPVVLTEMPINPSIADIFKMQRKYIQVPGWNETKKLINIYGIASLMSYFHSKNIIHRDLRPENIFLDEYLFPKIGYFDLLTRFNKEIDLSFQSIANVNEAPIYSAPEVLKSDLYSKSSDVYAFAFIVYEIIYKENPYHNYNSNKLFTEIVTKGNRPEIKKTIPDCYRKLIKKCWSQSASDRPTFDQIVKYLRNESEFITIMTNKTEFFTYVKYLDESNNQIQFNDFIKSDINFDDVENDNLSLNDVKSFFESDTDDGIEETENENHSSSETDDEEFERIKIIETEEPDDMILTEKTEQSIEINKDQKINEIRIERDEIPGIQENQLLQIQEYLNERNAKLLIRYLDDNFDNELVSIIFDKFHKESTDFYLNLCQEGILINNAVSHHKYAIFLISKPKEIEESHKEIEEARFHLETSINLGFNSSYFSLSFLLYEYFHDDEKAFHFAQEGSQKGDKYAKFLLGFFTMRGIGTEKNHHIGVSILLESGMNESYDQFATDIGIYYSRENKSNFDENESFKWFEKAYNKNKTKATINNYGICFLKGLGVTKNIEKAKSIFIDGIELIGNDNDLNYHLKFILDETNENELFKIYSQLVQQENTEKHQANIRAQQNNINEQTILFKKSIENNDSENIYKYFIELIKSGNYLIPLEFTVNLYKNKQFKTAFNYFSLLAEMNNPIAHYFIGKMKFEGVGCQKNKEESFRIFKKLSDNGIEQATEFLEDNFK